MTPEFWHEQLWKDGWERCAGADVMLTSVCVRVRVSCQPSFPEGPERLHAIKEQLIQEGLLDRCVSFQVSRPSGDTGWWAEADGAWVWLVPQHFILCVSLGSIC